MIKHAPMPDLQDLKTYLKIDLMSPSGLTWIKSYTNRIKVGSVAGHKKTYWHVNFKNTTYAVHRLVYFMHYEKDPGSFDVDHKDQNKHNNNPENLRLATRQQNNANTKSAKGSTSKYKGVYFSKQHSKWIASITKDYKHIYLGLFKSEDEAALAYNNHAQLLYGEYALLNQVDVIC